MSKYNLTDIHKGIIKEGMGRGGTIKDSFYNIANLADDIDGQNIGKDTYPIYVQRLGPSSDEKTYEEFAIRYGEGKDDRFNIYDYKFGEDPTDEDNYQNDYPFSLGVPTGNRDAVSWAKKLGFEVEGMQQPAQSEGEDPKHKDGTPKSNDEMTDDEREDFYMNLDSVDESKKSAIADEIAQWRNGNLSKEQLRKSLMDLSDGEFQLDSIKGFNNEAIEDLDEASNLDALAKKLGMSAEDLAAKVAKFQSAERGAIDNRAKLSMAEEEEHLKEHFQRFLKDYQ